MQHILVAVDFSEMGEAVVREAARVAQRMEAGIRLLHVAAPDPGFVGFEVGPQTVRDARAATLRQEHRRLDEWQKELLARGLQCEASLIAGRTVESILDQARKMPADLIVLGTHGRSVIHKVLVGNVAEGVLREARCPVLVIPPHAVRPDS